MKYLQLLSHEIGTECNLSEAHAHRCPISRRDRYDRVDKSKPLDDDAIVSDIRMAYALGFGGACSFHFYCEPLLYLDRIEGIIKRVSEYVTGARHVLWTNGTLIGKTVYPEQLRIFSKVIVSNYERRDWEWLREYVPDIKVLSGHLDGRLGKGKFSYQGCLRLYHELIIDAYGNWRLCCNDYMGTAVKMNVCSHGFAEIADSFLKMRALIATDPQPYGVPDICQRCRVLGRNVLNKLVDEPYQATMELWGR